MVNQYTPFEPDLTDAEKEAIRKAREMGLAGAAPPAPAPAAAPQRIAEMPLGPAPGGMPDYRESMANLLDPQGRRVLNPTPDESRAFAALLPQEEYDRLGPVADQYGAALAAYNATPRNEALFAQQPPAIGGQPSDVFGIPRGLTVGPDSSLVPMPGVMTPAEEDAYRASLAGNAAPAGSATSTDPFFQPEQTMSAAEERQLAQRQMKEGARAARGIGLGPGSTAGAPSFADNEAILQNALTGGQPVRQTEPDAEGNTYPDYGTLRDVLNQEYRLVDVGGGKLMVYDPRRDEWADFDPEDWTLAGQRRRRGG